MGPCSAHAGQYMQMGFVPAHLYKARASELQQGRRTRLDYCMLKHICPNLSIRVAKTSALHRLLHSDIHAHGSISLSLSLSLSHKHFPSTSVQGRASEIP